MRDLSPFGIVFSHVHRTLTLLDPEAGRDSDTSVSCLGKDEPLSVKRSYHLYRVQKRDPSIEDSALSSSK
jgi:hypothetical protein